MLLTTRPHTAPPRPSAPPPAPRPRRAPARPRRIKIFLSSRGPRRTMPGAIATMLALALAVTILPALQLGVLARPEGQASPGHSAPGGTAVPVSRDFYTSERDTPASPTLPAVNGLDALSPELAEYVAGVAASGIPIGVDVYDVTHDRTYIYNQDTPFTLASSAKVYILCAYLDRLEKLQRPPTTTERAQMYAMITQSDNNAAQWLYDRLGGGSGQQRYLQGLGITGYEPRGISWGWARLSPAGMVRILTMLHTGRILTPADRAYALGLLGHVAVGRWGVGDTAPRGAQVFMKDGWVTGPDGRWAQNSSGIVVVGDETYIISVYIQQLPRYDWSRVQHVCAAVAHALT